MKLTKSILKDLIKEEIEASLEEQEMRGIGTLTPIYPKNKFTRDGKKRVPGDVGQYEPAVPAFDPLLAKDRAPRQADMVARGGYGKEGRYIDMNDPQVQASEAHDIAGEAYYRLRKLQDDPSANPADIKKAEKEYKRLAARAARLPRVKSPAFPVMPGIDTPEGRLQQNMLGQPKPSSDSGYLDRDVQESIKESTLRTIIRETLEGMV